MKAAAKLAVGGVSVVLSATGLPAFIVAVAGGIVLYKIGSAVAESLTTGAQNRILLPRELPPPAPSNLVREVLTEFNEFHAANGEAPDMFLTESEWNSLPDHERDFLHAVLGAYGREVRLLPS